MRPIPVLMYHHVNPNKGDMVTVTPEVFERQMEYLYNAGYRTLKIDELISYINGELTFEEKTVVVTFDDGWLDNYIHAFPVLNKYRINATIFIVTDRTEKASENMIRTLSAIPTHKESKSLMEKGEERRVVLNWELIREIQNTGLVDFYSHTKSHARCDRLSENELSEELGESKKIIEERLGRPCPYLCWPDGKYSDIAVNIAKDVDYKAIFTTDRGIVKVGADLFTIKRIVIKDNSAWFKKRVLLYTNPIFSELYLKIKKK